MKHKGSTVHTVQAAAIICIATTEFWRRFVAAVAAAVVGSNHAGAAGTLRGAGIGLARETLSMTVHVTRICAAACVCRRRAVPVSLRFGDRCITYDYHELQR